MSHPSVLFGCAGIRGSLTTYARRFDVIELDPFQGAGVREPTLRRWRKEAGPTLQIAVVAPAIVSAVRPSAALDEGLERLLGAQRLLQARFILIPTPIEVTPAPLPRERIQSVVTRIRAGLGEACPLVQIAWEPRGVWEAETAAQFASQLGIDLCLDPLTDPREPFWTPVVRYVRLTAIGGRTAFPAVRLRRIAELLASAETAEPSGQSLAREDAGTRPFRAVIFATPHAPKEAKRLRSLIDHVPAADGGRSRLISPSGRVPALELEEE